MKIAFLDTETTGLNPEKNDPIQISGVIFNNLTKINTFDFTCQPVNWSSISQQALDVNKRTIEELKTFDHPINTLRNFVQFMKDNANGEKLYLGGQNIRFDYNMLEQFMYKNRLDDICINDLFHPLSDALELQDLSAMAMKDLNITSKKLGVVTEALGIIPDGELHNALTDIEVTYKAYWILLKKYGKSLPSNKLKTQKTLMEAL